MMKRSFLLVLIKAQIKGGRLGPVQLATLGHLLRCDPLIRIWNLLIRAVSGVEFIERGLPALMRSSFKQRHEKTSISDEAFRLPA